MAPRSGWRRRDSDETDGLDRASAERLLSEVIESTDTELAVVDGDLVVVTANAPFRERVLGGADPSGRPLIELESMAGGAMADVLAAITSAVAGRTEVRMYTRDVTPSGIRWLDVTASPIASAPGAVVRARDVTELVEAARESTLARLRDPRTGMLGPHTIVRELTAALETLDHGVLCVAMLHIDQQTMVRSAAGERGADELVAQVTNAIRRQLPPNSILGRLDTETFVVVFGARNDDDADAAVSSIRDAVRQPVTVGPRTLRATTSLGYEMVRADDSPRPTAAMVLATADEARHSAARRGGNRAVRHVADATGTPEGLLRLWNELRSALQFRQMEVWFQPIVRLDDGRPVAAEALVRWHHPQLGDIAPSDFIPTAERNSEILAIGSFVHDRAAQVMRLLRTDSVLRRTPLQIAINAAADELAWPQYAVGLLARLDANDVDPSHVSLEISSRVLDDNDDDIISSVRTLAQSGMTVTVDDFGSAVTALPHFIDLGVRRVKLPRSLVASVTVDWRSDRVVAALVSLARSLGLDVVASGVETEATAMRLREFGCAAAQGFLYSPAVPELELPSVLRELATPRQ